MPAQIMALAFALMLALLLVACSAAGTSNANGPAQADGGSAGSGELASGLFEMGGGKVKAIGTLTWVDLEGGFWALTDDSAAGNGSNIAVIANGAELGPELDPLEGQKVTVTGERFEGASIRMAGPEIIAESVEKF